MLLGRRETLLGDWFTLLYTLGTVMSDPKKLQKIKSSLFSRSLSLAKLTLSTSGRLASHGIRKAFQSEEETQKRWGEFLTTQAESFSRELGELKGSLMKAGQMLSMYGEHFLPAEANRFLKTLQSSSPALSWVALEPVVRKRLSQEVFDELAIETECIGSASLGQVHRAKILSSGDSLALKVQYPGVDQAIDSDLRNIRRFLSMVQLLPQNFPTDSLFSEIREMLLQEVDYSQEAEQTERYRQRLGDDVRFVVPKVFRRYSGPQILATSYESGISADDPLVQALSLDRRNRLALNFLDLYFRELFQWGVVQTDPHLGNYRVRLHPQGEDQLVLLDFGAVRSYPQEFLRSYHRMIGAALRKDRPALERAASELAFLQDGDETELRDHFVEFCWLSVEPFQVNSFDWKNTDLPDRLTAIVFAMAKKFRLRAPPREMLFLDRKTGGVFIFLKVLGAKLNARPLLEKYLAEVDAL